MKNFIFTDWLVFLLFVASICFFFIDQFFLRLYDGPKETKEADDKKIEKNLYSLIVAVLFLSGIIIPYLYVRGLFDMPLLEKIIEKGATWLLAVSLVLFFYVNFIKGDILTQNTKLIGKVILFKTVIYVFFLIITSKLPLPQEHFLAHEEYLLFFVFYLSIFYFIFFMLSRKKRIIEAQV